MQSRTIHHTSHYLSCLLLLLFIVTNSAAQSKKERKAKLTDVDMGMYNYTENEDAKKYYQEGMEKHKSEEYKDAISLYKKAIEADPEFVEAYDNLAVCYRRTGDFKHAIEYYQKSIELYPRGTMAHSGLGVIYGIQKNYQAAIDEYKTIQEIDPNDPEGYYGTILNYLHLGNAPAAIHDAQKTLEIYEATDSPYLADAQYLLGLSYYYNKESKKAKVYLQQASDNGAKIPEEMKKELKIK